MLRENSRSIDTHLGGESFEHIGVIISDIAYEVISPLASFVDPLFPGLSPEEI
jgi:hypothetical protein